MAGRCRGGSARTGGVGQLVMNGPLILAVPVAAAAGAITFISPCCLPLIPGYLSYVTGMSGADAGRPGASASSSRPDSDEAAGGSMQGTAGTATIPRATAGARAASGTTAGTAAGSARGRALAGTAPFVLGLSALLARYGAAVRGLGDGPPAPPPGLLP